MQNVQEVTGYWKIITEWIERVSKHIQSIFM